MDAFPDGGFVRLESRLRPGRFVHADEDWEKVFLCPNNPFVPSLNAVWRVQHRVGEGYAYVLLQNAAFGRYLSYTKKKAQFGHHGVRITQRNHREPNVGFNPLHPYPWMWTVQRLPPPDEDYVSLCYITCYLRANGSWILRSNNRVTADLDPVAPLVTIPAMMHWKVHTVTASPVPSPQPLPLTVLDQGDGNYFPHPPRTIRHVLANDAGEFDQNHHNWASFDFYDSTVTSLKNELQVLQGWNEDMATYTLCMRPGSHGRVMPLVTNRLPGSLDSMNIVVYRTGTPAAAALRYPVPGAADGVVA